LEDADAKQGSARVHDTDGELMFGSGDCFDAGNANNAVMRWLEQLESEHRREEAAAMEATGKRIELLAG
jgi:hypothetical protein